MLTINLKIGSFIELKKFEKVLINSEQGVSELSKSNFSQFILDSHVSYTFIGDSQISIQSKEILFLEYESNIKSDNS